MEFNFNIFIDFPISALKQPNQTTFPILVLFL